MRVQLRKLNGQRLRFSATVERFGQKSAFRGPPLETILLKDVRLVDTGEIVTDHLWFTRTKSWQPAITGCEVVFDARVSSYTKGYQGYREDVLDAPVSTDYRLERPTRVQFFEGKKGVS